MKKILIYGSGFFDVVKLIEAINRASATWEILGFLDDTPGLKGKKLNGYPVLGGRELLAEHCKHGEVHIFNNVNGTREGCRGVASLLRSCRCPVPTLVHPAVDLNYVRLGDGCIVPEGCVLGANVALGDFVTLRYGGIVSHEVAIGDFTLLGPGAVVGGRSTIKENCVIGAGSTVLTGITVDANSTVGAGAVVIQDVPAGKTVAGIPAKEV
ncbi:MAG TPA: DapH/DapD/GlmU-related protein [Candidatus Omnitrophota bacterium]|nr:DapH/DapD/GlmU-related protein [Candidatus Omnitrophota bacterium]